MHIGFRTSKLSFPHYNQIQIITFGILQPPSNPYKVKMSAATQSIRAPVDVQTSPKAVNPLNPTGIKPCCACPESKSARDECFLKFGHSVAEHGEQARQCEELVRKHKECMASLGFKV